MAHLTASTEINDEDDCQLVSFTNKLPYYVRHLCKSTNKNKTAAVTSIQSEYLRKKISETICRFKKERKIMRIPLKRQNLIKNSFICDLLTVCWFLHTFNYIIKTRKD